MVSTIHDVDGKRYKTAAKSPARAPATPPKTKGTKRADFGSEGVTDNDILLLPRSDYQILGLLTCLALVVRLFRIYQPTSVVFDEVQ